jgi:CRP-like cAMP-binding protein
VAMVAATLGGLVLIGAAATRRPSAFEETLARVARLPLFTGVAAPALERALGQLRPVPVSAGDVVVRQGDAADRFYIIQTGRFEVTQAGPDGAVRRLRELGPDEVFGEIGLLAGSARTATVGALTDGLLLELEGPEFLALVGAEGALRGRLLAMYGEMEYEPVGAG